MNGPQQGNTSIGAATLPSFEGANSRPVYFDFYISLLCIFRSQIHPILLQEWSEVEKPILWSHVVEIRISGCARIQPPEYNVIESEEQWIGSRKVLVLASALPKTVMICLTSLSLFLLVYSRYIF